MKWRRGQVLRTKFNVIIVLEQPTNKKGRWADPSQTDYKVFYIRHKNKRYGDVGYIYKENLERDWYIDDSGDFDEEINLIKTGLL